MSGQANIASLINSKIHNKIMKGTRLRKKSIDSKTDADRIAYNKQRDYCVSLIRKEKRSTVISNQIITVILKYVT